MRPTLRNRLSQWLNFIPHLKFRQIFLNLISNFLGSECHSLHIVTRPNFYRLFWGIHQLNRSINSIIGIDHGKRSRFVQITLKGLTHNCTMKNTDCIISGPTSGRRSISHKPWISDASNINSITPVVVSTPHFPCFFGNAVNSGRLHNRELRSLLWRCSSKCCYWWRPEYLLYFALSPSL